MRKTLPSIALAAGLVAVVWSLLPARTSKPDLAAAGTLPALQGGRVKPLDTIARSTLLMIRGKQTVTVDGRRLTANEWLYDVMARPAKADRYHVFVVDDPDVLGLFAIELEGRKYFSFEDLKPYFRDIETQAEQASRIESPARTRFQSAIVGLNDRLNLYQRLKNSLRGIL